MRRLLSLLFPMAFSLLFCPSLPVVADPVERIELFVGQTEVLDTGAVKRVSVGNGKLAEVKVFRDSGQVMLIALSPGLTDLRIWSRDGTQRRYLLRIVHRSIEELLSQIEGHLSDIEGVRAEIVGDRIVIRGQSLREDDQLRVNAVAAQFPDVVSYVTSGGITLQSMIYFDVKVVEVRKSSLKKIGVDWADFMSGPTYGVAADWVTADAYRGTALPGIPFVDPPPADVGTQPFFGISSTLTSIINLLDQNGDARMLAEPKLACRSGGEAEFLVGGEVPIPISQANGSVTVLFKQYGIILKIEPRADPEGYIDTRVTVEVSAIDTTLSVAGYPGFTSRKAETDMNLREGQTMVIAGLFNSDDGKEVEKIPGLGSIPVLGELFKSREFRNSETELVILVTPFLMDAEHRINRENLERVERLEQRADRRLRFSIMD